MSAYYYQTRNKRINPHQTKVYFKYKAISVIKGVDKQIARYDESYSIQDMTIQPFKVLKKSSFLLFRCFAEFSL